MAINIEIKAHARDPQELMRRATELSDQPEEILKQHDVFFRCNRGMLKLRQINGCKAELIAYERDSGNQPRPSRYSLVAVNDFDAMRRTLASSLGELAEVRKTRRLLICGRTRIHLDHVEGLGDFLELEVVLETGDVEKSGHAEASSMMCRLGVLQGDLLDRTYAEMLGASI